MNTIAYLIYLFLTYLITVHVGLRFYRNGRPYILQLLHGNESLTDFINRILLTGYYLLNLGYAALMLQRWQTVQSWEQVLTSVLTITGKIMLTLAVIHFFNMTVLYLYSKQQSHFLQPKK